MINRSHHFHNVFLRNQSKPEKEILTFYAITYEPIKIQKPQNERLNITFVKDTDVNAEKLL